MKPLPKASLVVLCRDEEQNIKNCVDSLLIACQSLSDWEILVVDGMSKDRSVQIVTQMANHNSRIKLLLNPKQIAPAGINVGIRVATGEVIFLLGAHTQYSDNYISECLEVLEESGADCVGGRLDVRARDQTPWGIAMESVLGSAGAGGPSKHRVTEEYARYLFADTAPYAAYRKAVFNSVGLFDERMVRSLDTEFSLRLRKAGRKIAVASTARATYLARSKPSEVSKYYFTNGEWLFRPLSFGIRAFEIRHLAPTLLVFVVGLGFILSAFRPDFGWISMGVLILYLSFLFVLSLKIKNKIQRLRFIALTIIVHWSAGVGSLWGLATLPIYAFRKTVTS